MVNFVLSKSKWITGQRKENCYSFVKEINVTKKVVKAYINASAIGWYHVYINDQRLDQDIFTPGWTDYRKRVQYQHFDFVDMASSKLQFKFELAEGWGGGERMGWQQKGVYNYFEKSIIFEIVIEYADGTIDHIVSDENIDVYTNDIIDSSVYYGEQQDCFKLVEYLGKAKVNDINTKLIPQEGNPIIEGEHIPAKDMFLDNKGNVIVDFGQNMAGYVVVSIKGKKGDKISFTPFEVLDKDGNFYNENYRRAKTGIYSYVLNGEEQVLKPRFSFMGGRYIKVIDCPDYVKKENFEAVLVHSKLDRTGTFECGHPMINRLYKNIIYGQLSNFIDVPTDCPQRDERLGWTADAQVFFPTAAINYNVQSFFKKWLNDMIEDQFEDGKVLGIVPNFYSPGLDNMLGSGWSDACVIIPYELYKAYNDKDTLDKCLPMMKKWLDYTSKHYIKPYIVLFNNNWGDWLALDIKSYELKRWQGATRYDLVSTAYYIHSLDLYIKSCDILGVDHQQYDEILKCAEEAYRNEFIKDGHMVGEKALMFGTVIDTCYTQTGILFTLAYDICEEKDRDNLYTDLVNLIKECGNKMSTGFLGTPLLLNVLSKGGYEKLAFDLLLEEGYPSWLYSVKKGGTTIWEHYDGIKEDGSFWPADMNSYNHYAYGSVYQWIFNNAVGINIEKPGYEEITIKPIVDKRLGYVKGTYKTKFGVIKSSWKISGNRLDYEFDVPKGIKASIIIGNKIKVLTNGGTYKESMEI